VLISRGWVQIGCKLRAERGELSRTAADLIRFYDTDFTRFFYRSELLRLLALEIRDVGVAGSNPVTPTIDYIEYFLARTLVVPALVRAVVLALVPLFSSKATTERRTTGCARHCSR
jgi:hypothetical protein